MNTQKKIIVLFIIIAIGQWVVPGKMVYDQVGIRKFGTPFLFEIQPIDPVDPFRGNYIVLRFFENMIKDADTSEAWEAGDKIYLALGKDENNFAKITDYSASRFSSDQMYVEAKVDRVYPNGNILIEYPFRRFYLDQERVQRAEETFFNPQDTNAASSYAVVYVLNGSSSIVDVIANGVSVLE